ncbi:8-amino-7-oxononanoate synthase [Tenacibaculum sp. 190524A02b]|uniref:aminotransferase class I/II-fold pyridoxal phosphate-dependent enzyme n=1 Tax=Tenacibaculum vairaonense TaxID=3137860 RepID=UPI0032B23482
MNFPEKLQKKLQTRRKDNALRSLKETSDLVDFSSNDYLGFARSNELFEKAHQFLMENQINTNGATGSRLLSGNHKLFSTTEKEISTYHRAEAALLFNSGYNTNVGFFAAVPQRGDVVLYDELIHASIRDGIQLSNAKAYKFKHNNVENLKELILKHKKEVTNEVEIYVVTESVFSMDGDIPDVLKMVEVCSALKARLIIDEAHALGVIGKNGMGIVQNLEIEEKVFARIITFGKALGCHGAVVLGANELKEYLINYARSFIYTTALPPHAVATIKIAYQELASEKGKEQIKDLQEKITYFVSETQRLQLNFIPSKTAIHCCIIGGNTKTKQIAKAIQKIGFDIKPILSPTVAIHKERLRFCLHNYNTKKEITEVLENLVTFVS